MLLFPAPASVRLIFIAVSVLLALILGGCAGMLSRDPIRINVVGIEPLAGQGLEMRFAVTLRLQNPNETAIEYGGVALELELNGKPFASGVSDQKGSVSRFGETVFSVPVTVSAFAAVRQALGLADGAKLDNLPYVLRGKLAGGMFGGMHFTDQGTLSLSSAGKTGE
ncbi:MAG: LEA type 2 family protein [Gammaproteobacteria bacterium]